MASLADVEGFLERIFERTTARLFRARLTVVQLERRIERTMELARRPSDGRVTVPSRYHVRLHPRDLAQVAGEAGGAEALAGRLADAALALARRHGYQLTGRPTVSIVADPALEPGNTQVDAVREAAPAAPGGFRGASADGVPDPSVAERTQAFRRPEAQAPSALLRVLGPGSRERTVRVDGTPLTIGRAKDNALVLADPGVSRHHGRLQGRSGLLVYADLGSTNGSRVNGVAVDEVVLGPGDRIALGATMLVVEPVD